jgi:uncharacterized protein
MALYTATAEASYRDHAGKALDAFSSSLSQVPGAMPAVVLGLEQYLNSRPERLAAKPPAASPLDDIPERIVTASASPAGRTATTISPGREWDAVVTVAIEKGWHIYANPAGPPEMKPTTLDLETQPGGVVRLISVKYPAGESRVLESLGTEKVALYEGNVELTLRLKLADDARPGPCKVSLKLSYQACNDRLCQAPARLEIPLTVTIGQ